MIEKVWKEFKDRLKLFIISKVDDKSIAEDILQDIFIKIQTNINSLTQKDKLSSWIYQITRNTITDYYRKSDKQKKQLLEDEILPDISKEEYHLNQDLLCCLKPFIEELPEKYKDALLHTNYGTGSQKEYAEHKGLSYSAAKSRIQRARAKLKESFIKCCKINSDKYGNVISVNKKKCDCD